jgi:8-oxo-dGTP pyrophosphatase MutT (NUDIX family)
VRGDREVRAVRSGGGRWHQNSPSSLFAVVRDDTGRILLCRRADTGDWEIPGGSVEVGESALDAVRREVEEETGVLIVVTWVSGIYTDPGYVIAYSTGEVRQQFAVCFHARPRAGATSRTWRRRWAPCTRCTRTGSPPRGTCQ